MTISSLLKHEFVGEDKEHVCDLMNVFVENTENRHQLVKIHEVTFSKREGKTVAVMEYYLGDD
ncbi:hypothetical protein [Gracilibacillus sp. Marseille-QA3620]